MHRRFRSVCLWSVISGIIGNHSVFAQNVALSSSPTAATIFSDRAIVSRIAKGRIPEGLHVVTLSDMPADFDETSLRVEGKSQAKLKIGAVDVKHGFLTDQANAAERDHTAALEAKRDEKAIAEGEIAALRSRENFINRLAGGGTEKEEKDNSVRFDFSPEKWAQAWTAIQSGMNETQKQLVQKNATVRQLNAEIVKLEGELAIVATTRSTERRLVAINVEAERETDAEFRVSYQTTSASWRSVYDARLDTASGSLDLDQYGEVTQQTGEDWNDIDLTFSTAQPANGTEMPRLMEWVISLFQPMRQMRAAAAGGMSSPYALAKANKESLQNAPSAPSMDSLAEKADVVPVSTQTSEYAADFHVTGKVSVKSARDSSKVFVASIPVKATLSAEITPRLIPEAYLFARITNDKDYPLIPGAVAKYRDGNFIGSGTFALLRAGETADLSFGGDDRIKVTHRRTREEQSNPLIAMIGDMEIKRSFETKVQNLHKEPLTVKVFEQYPLASDPDIKSKLLDDQTTPGYVADEDKRQNVIVWTAELAPKAEKTFGIGFEIDYPKGQTVNGL